MTKAELLMHSDEEVAVEIGRHAKEKRLSLNVSQRDFAKEVGMSHLSYMEFENTGKTSAVKLIRILRRLNLLGEMIMGLENRNSIEALGVDEYYRRSTAKPRIRAAVKKTKDKKN